MPLPSDVLDELAHKHVVAEEAADRDRRKALVFAALQCVIACGAGLFLLAFALHTTDEKLGRISFFGGLLVGNGGILIALTRAYLRGERRGDW